LFLPVAVYNYALVLSITTGDYLSNLTSFTPLSFSRGLAANVILKSETTKNPFQEGDNTDSSRISY